MSRWAADVGHGRRDDRSEELFAVNARRGVMLSGCISLPHLTYTPRAYPVPPTEIKPISAKGPVAVVAIADETPEQRLAGSFYYTPSATTEDAARVLRETLTAMGVTVSADAPDVIELKIDEIKVHQGFAAVFVTVMLHVESESGYERVFEGMERSTATVTRAANAAIGRAVRNLLADQEFIDQLVK